MAGSFESSGDIEILCRVAGAVVWRGTVPAFDELGVGDRLFLVFRPEEGSSPPYQLKIVSPSGATIMDTIVRDLPDGTKQSTAAPIEFIVSLRGTYRIELREKSGRQKGEATLVVK
jgi:hypothetical protein